MKNKIKNEIKLDFYDDFRCTADACPITCCQEWSIQVDEDTKKKWNQITLKGPETKRILTSVCNENGVDVISLNEKKECPFLSEQRLCRLVIEHGDDFLSQTCATFPREIHEFKTHTEYSLVAGCPEVIDQLWKQRKIRFLSSIDESSEELGYYMRKELISLFQNKEYSISKCLMMGFYLLLEYHQRNELDTKANMNRKEDEKISKWKRLIFEVSYVELSNAMDEMEFSNQNTFEERNLLFLDLVENYIREHRYQAYLKKILPEAKAFEEEYDVKKLMEQIHQFHIECAKYENLFRNYLITDLFHSILIPDSDENSFIMMYQWVTLEYTLMKHALFLVWLHHGTQPLPYEKVRETMVFMSRMTGYDEEDVCEYLTNEFQSPLWDWGYLALIVGEPFEDR